MADEAKTDEELAAQVREAASAGDGVTDETPEFEAAAEAVGKADDLDWAEEDVEPGGGEAPGPASVGKIETGPGEVAGGQEAEPADPPAETKVRRLTEYVVLEAVNVKIGEQPVEMWRRVDGPDGQVQTFKGSKALDAAHDALARDHGALVAIPERSWKPKRPVEKPRPPVVGWE